MPLAYEPPLSPLQYTLFAKVLLEPKQEKNFWPEAESAMVRQLSSSADQSLVRAVCPWIITSIEVEHPAVSLSIESASQMKARVIGPARFGYSVEFVNEQRAPIHVHRSMLMRPVSVRTGDDVAITLRNEGVTTVDTRVFVSCLFLRRLH